MFKLVSKNKPAGDQPNAIKKLVKGLKKNYRYQTLLGVTGSGITVHEARHQMYSRINNIMLQNMFYRTDIGLKWNQDSDKLQMWGYLY